MTDALQIVASRLLFTLMGCDGCVSSGSCKILTILVGDVLACTVLVAFGEAEINYVDCITSVFGRSNQEVVGLDVSMNDSLVMALSNVSYELNGNHQDSLEIKLTFAVLEQIFQ